MDIIKGIIGDTGGGVYYNIIMSNNSYYGRLIGRGVIVGVGGLFGGSVVRDFLYFNDGSYNANSRFYHLYLFSGVGDIGVGDYYMDISGGISKCYNLDVVSDIICWKIIGSTDNSLGGSLLIILLIVIIVVFWFR